MKNLKITHYLDNQIEQPRAKKGTFKRKPNHKNRMLVTDIVTIIVMSAMIYHGFTAKPATAQAAQNPTCIASSCKVDLNLEKQEMLQGQISALNAQLGKARTENLNLQ